MKFFRPELLIAHVTASCIEVAQAFHINSSIPSNSTTIGNSTRPQSTSFSLPNDVEDCVLYAGNVQVLYFHESNATNSSLEVITAVSDGYTFTSPSVYVAWSTVSAGVEDWIGGKPPTTLAAHYNVTKAYPPGYLMTVPGGCNYHEVGKPWSTLRVSDLMSPPQNWISDEGCFWRFDSSGEGTGPLGGVDPNGTVMAASPVLSYPPDILTLDPSWKNCGSDAYNWGDYDPPRVLTPAGTLMIPMAGPRTLSSVTAIINLPGPRISSSINRNLPPMTMVPEAPFTHVSIIALPANNMPGKVTASKTTFRTKEVQPAKTDIVADPPVKTYVAGGQGGNPLSMILGPLLGAPIVETPDQNVPAPEPTAMAIATAGSNPVFALSGGEVSVAGNVVNENGPAVTVGGVRISVNAHSIYVGASKIERPSLLAGMGPAPHTIDGQRFGIDRNGNVVLGDQTMVPGSQTVIHGHLVSIGIDRIVAGSHTYALPSSGSSAPEQLVGGELGNTDTKTGNDAPLISGHPIEAGQGGAIIVDGLTVSEGQQTTADGTYISIGATDIVVGTKTYNKPTATDPTAVSSPSHRDVFIGGKIVDLPILPEGLIQDLAVAGIPAGFQTTISGAPISAGSNVIVIGKSTYALPLPTSAAISRAPNGAIIFDRVTLTQGQQTSISSTPVSVNGNLVVIGGKTYDLPLPTSPAVSLARDGEVVFDGVTLAQGEATTISGTAVSLASGVIVIGGRTFALPETKDVAGAALGAIVASMYGYTGAARSSSGSLGLSQSNGSSSVDLNTFTGSARRFGVEIKVVTLTFLLWPMYCLLF